MRGLLTPLAHLLDPRRLGEWLHAHDLGYGVLRRAARAAILMPACASSGPAITLTPPGGCRKLWSDRHGSPRQRAERMGNADIAREGFAAIARGDFDAVSEFLDPDVKWHGGNAADGCQNRTQALAWIRGRGRRQSGPLPALVEVVEDGDRVLVVMQPAPSDEDPHPQRTANLATFRDGRAVEMVHYDDAAEALAALRQQ